MARHIYFITPQESRPTGGINVIFRLAEILRDHGHSVSVHFTSPSFSYEYIESTVETTYSPHVGKRGAKYATTRALLATLMAEGTKAIHRSNVNRLSVPSSDDLIVIPEFWYGAQIARFPNVPHIVLSQAYTTTLEMVVRSEVAGGLPDVFRGYIATSRICEQAARMFSKAPVHHVPLYLDPDDFDFAAEKERVIAFMPRRRAVEAQVVVDILRNIPELKGFRFEAIDRKKPAQVREILSRSLIFLSFSEREGFGLPPAEAIASGCLVIGYTGAGGDEYFTPDVAFPIPDDNTVVFLRTVLEVVREYEANPARLDALRRSSSSHILETYEKKKTTAALLKAFDVLAT